MFYSSFWFSYLKLKFATYAEAMAAFESIKSIREDLTVKHYTKDVVESKTLCRLFLLDSESVLRVPRTMKFVLEIESGQLCLKSVKSLLGVP